MKNYILPDGSACSVATIQSSYKTFWNRWNHKLFHCPTFWKMLLGVRKKYRCSICNKPFLCFWDANDIEGYGTNICSKCAKYIGSHHANRRND